MDHFPAQLSGGEQQRVAVARAIAKRPSIMLCDEPTGALDVRTGVRVLEALVDVNRRFGSTLLLVTHNADVARLGDRVVRFLDGSIRSITPNDQRAAPADLEW
jgi:putative ABC transport system ATP-binding protein